MDETTRIAIVEEAAVSIKLAQIYGQRMVPYQDFYETMRMLGTNLESVARVSGRRDGRDLLFGLNVQLDANGNLEVPDAPKPASLAGKFIAAAKEANEQKHRKRTFYGQQYKKTSSTRNVSKYKLTNVPQQVQQQMVSLQTGPPQATQAQVNIHAFDGNVENLQPGMYVQLANGTTHILPIIPQFQWTTDQGRRLQEQATVAYNKMVRELVLQHEIAIKKQQENQ